MDAINGGYENGHPYFSDARNVRACKYHFHLSVILLNSKDKYELKTGASPTICLTKFSMANDNFEEDTSLPIIVGSAENIQHVCNYEDKNNEILNHKKSAIVNPTRDFPNNKRNFELLEFEEKSNRPTFKMTS